MLTDVTLDHADAVKVRNLLAGYIAQLSADIESGDYFKGGQMEQLLSGRLADARHCHKLITSKLHSPLVI